MTEREGGRRHLDRLLRIAAPALDGLTYSEGVFDRERYEELRKIAAIMLAEAAWIPAGATDSWRPKAATPRRRWTSEVTLPWAVYKIFVRCEITGGAARPCVETGEVGFFAEDALPPLSEGRVTAAQLRSMFEHHRDPHRPADFD